MSVKLYLLFCSHCSYKRTTDGTDLANLREVKTCKSCGGSRQFKCPQCGYLIRATKANTDTQDQGMLAAKKQQAQLAEKDKRRKKEIERRIKDRRDDNQGGSLL